MNSAILVDTHLILWVRVAPQRLTDGELCALEAARSRYVSIVTLWEIAILMALGRIGHDLRLLAVPDGFDLLPLMPEHCKTLIALPKLHRDPFDQMLIAQARTEQLVLLTRDRAIIAYGPDGAQVLSFGA